MVIKAFVGLFIISSNCNGLKSRLYKTDALTFAQNSQLVNNQPFGKESLRGI